MIIKICDKCGAVVNNDTIRYIALSDTSPLYGCSDAEVYHLCVSCYMHLQHTLRPRDTDNLTLSDYAYKDVFGRARDEKG